MKSLLLFLLCFCGLHASHSIVLVHLGPKLPSYLPTAALQARMFNPDCPIYLLANQEALNNAPPELNELHIQCVPCETLPKSAAHKQFARHSTLDKSFREGFWTFTTERFFCLSEFIKEHNLSNVFHMENDVMLYANLAELLPAFEKNYPNMIAATFDNDTRCIPGFLYVASSPPLEQFVEFIASRAHKGGNDMEFLAQFKRKFSRKWVDCLPILMPDYAKDHELVSTEGHRGRNPDDYSRNFSSFASIFDAAAIGQYLGGIDPIHRPNTVGFINESCVFNPSKWAFVWEPDAQGRKIPYAVYNNQKWRINNLHVHCKNLAQFLSTRGDGQ